jgi:predicted GH43/DUF377 family glycosyl hydrolase
VGLKLTRSKRNPILSPGERNWENRYVYNCAAFVLGGDIHLLYRAQGEDMVSRLGLARLSGIDRVGERSGKPVFAPDPNSEYEVLGVEDPRVTQINDTYYIVYTAASKYPDIVKDDIHPPINQNWRVRVSLARTRDFVSFIRYGVVIAHIDSKDAGLFPEKIEGNFLLIHRVIPHARLAISQNSKSYKERGPLFGPRSGKWDSFRIGVGAQPIKSPHGWLLFYHGVDESKIYRLGLALLDSHNPAIVLARTDEPLLEPEESWEKEGLVQNVVFTCGAVETDREYLVYYGGADAVIGVASIEKAKVLAWAKERAECSKFHTYEQIGEVRTEESVERS